MEYRNSYLCKLLTGPKQFMFLWSASCTSLINVVLSGIYEIIKMCFKLRLGQELFNQGENWGLICYCIALVVVLFCA